MNEIFPGDTVMVTKGSYKGAWVTFVKKSTICNKFIVKHSDGIDGKIEVDEIKLIKSENNPSYAN